jgi:serine/threonine-protein kinase
MGEVYRATDINLGREVAIKVLPEAFAQDAERLARFEREARTLASLNHPNIAIVHGVEVADGVRALVMELVEGPTLAERIAHGAVPVDEAVAIARQVAEALETAHGQGIVHRDLKPANVKVRNDGTVKVLDFGLAKASDSARATSLHLSQSPTITTPAMTQKGMLLGTAAYMSPEQAKGHEADKRSDVWSFGCVLFEMLAGKRAFSGEDTSETLASVLRDEPDWKALPPGLSGSIRMLLESCLTKDRRTRARDMAVAHVLLNAHDHGLTTEPALPQTSSSRIAWLAAFGSAVVVGAIAAWLGWSLRSDNSNARRITRFALSLPENERLFAAGTRNLALSPDGMRLAYAANGRLYLWEFDRLASTPIRGTEGSGASSPRAPFFSPDGQWVGYWADGHIRKIAIAGGASVALGEAPRNPTGTTWTQEGTIVYGQANEGIWRVSANGGTAERIVDIDRTQGASNPIMLPDGRILFTLAVFGRGWDEGEIVVQRLQDGARHVLVNGGTDAQYLPSGHLVYVSRGTLYAVPMDPNATEISRAPTAIVEQVWQQRISGNAEFAVSATGTLVYVPQSASATSRQLVWVDRQGREEAVDVPPRPYLYPRLSPRGDRLALDIAEQRRDIWIYDFARKTLDLLTSDSAPDRAPMWTPDGRRIVFTSDRPEGSGLFWQDASGGSDAEALIQPGTLPLQFATAATADGKRFVLRTTTKGNDLMLFTPNGEPRLQSLLDSQFSENNADISRDGRWIAYESNRSNRDDVYVRPFPDTRGGEQVLISPGGGTEPLWSRASNELFYRTPGGGVIAVPFDAGSTWSARAPVEIVKFPYYVGEQGLDLRTYDVSPDGLRFLMIKEPSETGPVRQTIVVVQNWTEELKRLTGAR